MTEDLIKYKNCYFENTVSGSEISYKRPLLGLKDYNVSWKTFDNV